MYPRVGVAIWAFRVSFDKFCIFQSLGELIFYRYIIHVIFIFIFRRLAVTPQNPKFRTRQAIIIFKTVVSATKFFHDIPARDVATAFLYFNKTRVIKLFVTKARKPFVPPVLPVNSRPSTRPVL